MLMRCLRKVILKLTDFVSSLSYFRGIQLGRPELVKTWEKFEQKKSVKAEKEKVPDSELESRFRSISQKQEVRILWHCVMEAFICYCRYRHNNINRRPTQDSRLLIADQGEVTSQLTRLRGVICDLDCS